jgi:hypothetical protein
MPNYRYPLDIIISKKDMGKRLAVNFLLLVSDHGI